MPYISTNIHRGALSLSTKHLRQLANNRVEFDTKTYGFARLTRNVKYHYINMRILSLLLLSISIISCSEGPDLPPSGNQPKLPERNHNEVFSFEILPATGPGTIKQHGDTTDLLQSIPYLLTSGIIPPEIVMNEILSKGKVDAGMSGGAIWKPYKLKIGSFDSLVKELEASSKTGPLIYKQPDQWVKNYEDWNVWVIYIKYGVPWEEHKRLNDAVVVLEKQMDTAKDRNDEAKIGELHLKIIAAGTELSEFIMRHRK